MDYTRTTRITNTNLNIEENLGTVNIHKEKTVFDEIKHPEKYKTKLVPEKIDDLNKQLENRKFILLHSINRFDTNDILYYMAATLAEKNSMKVKRRSNEDTESISLTYSINQEKEPFVLILDDLHPTEIKDLIKFKELIDKRTFYVVASTSFHEKFWDFSNTIGKEEYWVGMDDIKNTYSSKKLIEELKKQLLANKENIFFRCDEQSKSLLEKDENLERIGKNLKEPYKITLFVYRLAAGKEQITEGTIKQALQDAEASNNQVVLQSFNALSDYHKFIVLGINFFHGMYEEQFFAAMELLVKEKWKTRCLELEALDYADLEAVSNFFSLVENSNGTYIIKSRFPNLRLKLIEEASKNLRRHVIATLPVFNKLIVDSIDRPTESWELYGTRTKRQKLRTQLAGTLSDIGLYNLYAAEAIFLELASHQEIAIQKVAAVAIAKWCDKNNDKRELVFETLKKWQTDSQFISFVRTKLMQIIGKDAKQAPINYMRSTILLTIGYAAAYDKPNHLSKDVLALLDDFLDDENSLVKNRLQYILPYLITDHATLLDDKGYLVKFLQHDNLIYPTGIGLARARLNNPERTISILNKWLEKTTSNSGDILGEVKKGCLATFFSSDKMLDEAELELVERDKMVLALIYVCQELILKEGIKSKFNDNQEVTAVLRRFRKKENHLVLKLHLFSVLVRLMDDKKPQLAEIIFKHYKKESEEDILIESFGRRYLAERKALRNGDAKMELKGRGYYDIWVDFYREDTYIETLVKGWLLKGSAEQRQLSFKVLLYFTAIFDIYETEEVERIKVAREKAEEKEILIPQNEFLFYLKKKWVDITFFIRKLKAFANVGTGLKNDIARIYHDEKISEELVHALADRLEEDDSFPLEKAKNVRSLYQKFQKFQK